MRQSTRTPKGVRSCGARHSLVAGHFYVRPQRNHFAPSQRRFQMTNSTFGDFLLRVGGVFALFAAGILFAKAYYPGYETTAVLIVSVAVFAVLAVRHFRRMAKRKLSRRQR